MCGGIHSNHRVVAAQQNEFCCLEQNLLHPEEEEEEGAGSSLAGEGCAVSLQSHAGSRAVAGHLFSLG